MAVNFDRIKNFRMNFDHCRDIHQIGEIINKIETSKDHVFLATLKCAKEYYGEFRVAAVYDNGFSYICDKDDLRVLIDNFPKEWKR